MFSRGADFGECRPGKEGEMTVSLDEQEDIRRMDRDGVPRSRIARELGVSRNTVAKYADMPDMSPEPPLARRRARPATDGLSRWIDAILEADLSVPGKQRHTAKRVYDRAVDEMGYEGSYSSIRRYVAAWRGEPCQYNGQRNLRFFMRSASPLDRDARPLSRRSKNSCITSAGTRSPMDLCGRKRL
jgi:predicted transcriptional regulator